MQAHQAEGPASLSCPALSSKKVRLPTALRLTPSISTHRQPLHRQAGPLQSVGDNEICKTKCTAMKLKKMMHRAAGSGGQPGCSVLHMPAASKQQRQTRLHAREHTCTSLPLAEPLPALDPKLHPMSYHTGRACSSSKSCTLR